MGAWMHLTQKCEWRNDSDTPAARSPTIAHDRDGILARLTQGPRPQRAHEQARHVFVSSKSTKCRCRNRSCSHRSHFSCDLPCSKSRVLRSSSCTMSIRNSSRSVCCNQEFLTERQSGIPYGETHPNTEKFETTQSDEFKSWSFSPTENPPNNKSRSDSFPSNAVDCPKFLSI